MHQGQCSTSDQHIRLTSAMIANRGIYGYVTQLSRDHHLSRQWLYLLQAKGQEAMKGKFVPKYQPTEQELQRDRMVLTLLTECHASREGMQKTLEVILGEHVSTGTISAIIHRAGQRAQAYLKRQIPRGKRAIAIDEQYSSGRRRSLFKHCRRVEFSGVGQHTTSRSGYRELDAPFMANARARGTMETYC